MKLFILLLLLCFISWKFCHAAEPQSALKEWSAEDVGKWLVNLNPVFEKYKSDFIKNGIDGEMLGFMTSEILREELNVMSKLHRAKILGNIKHITGYNEVFQSLEGILDEDVKGKLEKAEKSNKNQKNDKIETDSDKIYEKPVKGKVVKKQKKTKARKDKQKGSDNKVAQTPSAKEKKRETRIQNNPEKQFENEANKICQNAIESSQTVGKLLREMKTTPNVTFKKKKSVETRRVKTIKQLEKCIAFKPEISWAYVQISQGMMWLDNCQRAVEILNESIELRLKETEDIVEVMEAASRIYAWCQDIDGVLTELEEMFKMHLNGNDWRKLTLEDLNNQSSEKREKSIFYLQELSSLYQKSKDYITAAKILELLIQYNPRSQNYASDLVLAYSSRGLVKDAIIQMLRHLLAALQAQSGRTVGQTSTDGYASFSAEDREDVPPMPSDIAESYVAKQSLLLATRQINGGLMSRLMKSWLQRAHSSNAETAYWDDLIANCELDSEEQNSLSHIIGSKNIQIVANSDVKILLNKCLSSQKLFDYLITTYSNEDVVNYENEFGFNPLHFMASYGNVDYIRYLLSKKADIKKADRYGLTSIHHAVLGCYEDIVEEMLKGSIEVNEFEDKEERNPLDLACIQKWCWNELKEPLQAAGFELAEDIKAAYFDTNECSLESDIRKHLEYGNVDVDKLLTIGDNAFDEHRFLLKESDGGWLKVLDIKSMVIDEDINPEDLEDAFLNSEVLNLFPKSEPIDPKGDHYNRRFIESVNAEDITPEDFARDYLSIQKPVIIRGVMSPDNSQWKHVFKILHRQSLLKMFKNNKVNFFNSTVPYAEMFNLYDAFSQVQLHDYIEYMRSDGLLSQHPGYIFQPIEHENLEQWEIEISGKDKSAKDPFEGSPLKSIGEFPEFISPEKTEVTRSQKFQFYVGPFRSGVPIHFHQNGMNSLFYGLKRWFFVPPRYSAYCTKHVMKWLDEDFEKIKEHVIEGIQTPGDVVYIPDLWGHAVINLEESVGTASEFQWGAAMSAPTT